MNNSCGGGRTCTFACGTEVAKEWGLRQASASLRRLGPTALRKNHSWLKPCPWFFRVGANALQAGYESAGLAWCQAIGQMRLGRLAAAHGVPENPWFLGRADSPLYPNGAVAQAEVPFIVRRVLDATRRLCRRRIRWSSSWWRWSCRLFGSFGQWSWRCAWRCNCTWAEPGQWRPAGWWQQWLQIGAWLDWI